MAKIAFDEKFKGRDNDDGYEEIGRLIFEAWRLAFEANPEKPIIDRVDLLNKVGQVVNTQDKVNTAKTIQFDFVFDTDLDENTRLVWIAVPTPDVDEAGKGASTWGDWMRQYYEDLPEDQKREKRTQMGRACLFGCGR